MMPDIILALGLWGLAGDDRRAGGSRWGMRYTIGIGIGSGIFAIGAIICGISLFGAGFALDERLCGVAQGGAILLGAVGLLALMSSRLRMAESKEKTAAAQSVAPVVEVAAVAAVAAVEDTETVTPLRRGKYDMSFDWER